MSDFSLSEINERISKESVFIDKLRDEISSVVIGQTDLINRLLIGMLANGHILIEGVPGLAKTLLVKTIAQLIDAKFQRIQFTPDMLPADLIGTLIYNQKTGGFETRKGPIFSNIVFRTIFYVIRFVYLPPKDKAMPKATSYKTTKAVTVGI